MSNYRDFVHDFGGRCQDVLTAFWVPAKARDREVTLLLMATTAGFVVPYERVTEDQGFRQPRLDRGAYTAAREQLKRLLDERVGESELFRGQESWCCGPLVSAEGLPDDWPELRHPTPLAADAHVLHAVLGLRHGLAHGNVFTRSGADKQISELVFVSGGARGIPLRYVLVSPSDLARFLDTWFTAIKKLPLPHHDVLRAIAEAA